MPFPTSGNPFRRPVVPPPAPDRTAFPVGPNPFARPALGFGYLHPVPPSRYYPAAQPQHVHEYPLAVAQPVGQIEELLQRLISTFDSIARACAGAADVLPGLPETVGALVAAGAVLRRAFYVLVGVERSFTALGYEYDTFMAMPPIPDMVPLVLYQCLAPLRIAAEQRFFELNGWHDPVHRALSVVEKWSGILIRAIRHGPVQILKQREYLRAPLLSERSDEDLAYLHRKHLPPPDMTARPAPAPVPVPVAVPVAGGRDIPARLVTEMTELLGLVRLKVRHIYDVVLTRWDDQAFVIDDVDRELDTVLFATRRIDALDRDYGHEIVQLGARSVTRRSLVHDLGMLLNLVENRRQGLDEDGPVNLSPAMVNLLAYAERVVEHLRDLLNDVDLEVLPPRMPPPPPVPAGYVVPEWVANHDMYGNRVDANGFPVGFNE
jgi:hypothetical protein